MAKFKVGDSAKLVRMVLTSEYQGYEYLDEYIGTLGKVGTILEVKHEPVDPHDPVYLMELEGDPDGRGGYYSEFELAEPSPTLYEQAQAEVTRLQAKVNVAPSLEGKLQLIAAFFTLAAVTEQEKRPGVWNLISLARNLSQMIYEDRPVT